MRGGGEGARGESEGCVPVKCLPVKCGSEFLVIPTTGVSTILETDSCEGTLHRLY